MQTAWSGGLKTPRHPLSYLVFCYVLDLARTPVSGDVRVINDPSGRPVLGDVGVINDLSDGPVGGGVLGGTYRSDVYMVRLGVNSMKKAHEWPFSLLFDLTAHQGSRTAGGSLTAMAS